MLMYRKGRGGKLREEGRGERRGGQGR